MMRSRKECLGGQRCEPRSWKEAQYCTIEHSPVEASEIAARVNKRVGYLLDAANPDCDKSIRADLLDRVMEAAQNLALLHYLCWRFNGVFVPLVMGTAGDDEIMMAFTKAVTEVGQSGEALTRGLADRQLTTAEADDACREIDQAVAAFLALKGLIRSRVNA